MSNSKNFIIIFVALIILINWQNQAPDKTTFYGELISQQDSTYKLINIKIGRDKDSAKTKKILVYERPTQYANPMPFQDRPGNEEIILTKDPSTDLVKTLLDFTEIKGLSFEQPQVIWTFQKTPKHRKLEFIELVVFKQNNTQEHFLIDRDLQLFADTIEKKPSPGSEQKEFPFPAIKKLTLYGFYNKDCDDKSMPPFIKSAQTSEEK